MEKDCKAMCYNEIHSFSYMCLTTLRYINSLSYNSCNRATIIFYKFEYFAISVDGGDLFQTTIRLINQSIIHLTMAVVVVGTQSCSRKGGNFDDEQNGRENQFLERFIL